MTLVSVLIPSVGTRPEMMEQVVNAFARQSTEVEILPITGYSWGQGLNELSKAATGDYWLCACDDTVPHEGWFEAGRAMLDNGAMPASRYLNPDGSPLHPLDAASHGTELGWCRSFLLTPTLYARIGPFINTTWFADIDYSERLIAAGVPILACDGFAFTHLDGAREWRTEAEAGREKAEYERSQQEWERTV